MVNVSLVNIVYHPVLVWKGALLKRCVPEVTANHYIFTQTHTHLCSGM